MTPEGRVKKKLKLLLDNYDGRIYVNWPVPHGYGSPVLDCWGAINGAPFAIECKAPGKPEKPRQAGTAENMRVGGIATFVTDWDGKDGDELSMQRIKLWMDDHDR
jgi:hypothetical protein